MKKIAVLGSTGSIGKNTLRVASHLKEEIQVTVLAAHSNIDLLELQAQEYHPQLIAVYDEAKAKILQKRIPAIPVVSGIEGLKLAASCPDVNFVVSAISGMIGLIPTLAAIEAGKGIGLANKEALVAGGHLVMDLAKKHRVPIIPIDSEHSAIFQCLQGESKKSLRRIILTASGGPFRTFSREQLQKITIQQALKHPTWAMGPKVTIDSSTLMNKGLEVIEAYWLFGVSVDQISVLVHPQSIIHSMVEFVDSSIIAQLGEPSMILPIQYALTYPDRLPGLLPSFDFIKNNRLEFFEPDLKAFRCLHLAFDAIKVGGTMPCFMNAANEVLVDHFLNNRLEWTEIASHLEKLMQHYQPQQIHSLEDILEADSQARKRAKTVHSSPLAKVHV